MYIGFSLVILQKPKTSKMSGQPAKSAARTTAKGKGAKGQGHGKPPQKKEKTGPTLAQVHASAVVTGIGTPLGQNVTHARAAAAHKLPSFYEL